MRNPHSRLLISQPGRRGQRKGSDGILARTLLAFSMALRTGPVPVSPRSLLSPSAGDTLSGVLSIIFLFPSPRVPLISSGRGRGGIFRLNFRRASLSSERSLLGRRSVLARIPSEPLRVAGCGISGRARVYRGRGSRSARNLGPVVPDRRLELPKSPRFRARGRGSIYPRRTPAAASGQSAGLRKSDPPPRLS